MRWPWRRRTSEPETAASAALRRSAQQLKQVKQRQPRVDALVERFAELQKQDQFAEAFEAALRRRRT